MLLKNVNSIFHRIHFVSGSTSGYRKILVLMKNIIFWVKIKLFYFIFPNRNKKYRWTGTPYIPTRIPTFQKIDRKSYLCFSRYRRADKTKVQTTNSYRSSIVSNTNTLNELPRIIIYDSKLSLRKAQP